MLFSHLLRFFAGAMSNMGLIKRHHPPLRFRSIYDVLHTLLSGICRVELSIMQEYVQNFRHSSVHWHQMLQSGVKISSLVPLQKEKRITQQVSHKTLGEPEHWDIYPAMSVHLCQGTMPPLLEQKYRISLKRGGRPNWWSSVPFFFPFIVCIPPLSLCSPFLAPHTAAPEIKALHAFPSFSLLYIWGDDLAGSQTRRNDSVGAHKSHGNIGYFPKPLQTAHLAFGKHVLKEKQDANHRSAPHDKLFIMFI